MGMDNDKDDNVFSIFFLKGGKMGEFLVILVAAAFIISCGGQVQSDVSDHRYKAGDLIPCYARGTGFVNEKKQTLRDILTGDQYLSSPYKLEFLVNEDSEVVCEKNLTKEEVLKFQDAVAKDYYIQMYCDDMPIWTFIGRMDTKKKRYFLYVDFDFSIYYNKEHLIEISA
ncbi:hypothetical protein NC651_020709 [Populus alba x Populus x berolinensis]|nr:hypothetical protein NC651_020709 [Populus alba x Populus x berolinensis]